MSSLLEGDDSQAQHDWHDEGFSDCKFSLSDVSLILLARTLLHGVLARWSGKALLQTGIYNRYAYALSATVAK